jgi:hypothetical protein
MDTGSKEATCAECAALWRAYAKATADHVELVMRKERTIWTTIITASEMEKLIEDAASRREAARMAIESHLRTAHAASAQAPAASFCRAERGTVPQQPSILA